jgi:hypothetical protein
MPVFTRPEAEIYYEVYGYLQPGTDTPHPAETSAEIEQLAPHLEVRKDWRGPTHLAESIRRVIDFLTRHTP